jgi:hypothetical protein
MVTKSMRQSSRQATDIHRLYGRTSRAVKITPDKWAKATKKPNLWTIFKEWAKKLIGGK